MQRLSLLMMISCALSAYAAEDSETKVVRPGNNGTVEFQNARVKLAADAMRLTVTPGVGVFREGSAEVAADAAATWVNTIDTEPKAEFTGLVHELTPEQKGKIYTPRYNGAFKTVGGGGPSGGGEASTWNLEGKFRTLKVEITNKAGVVLEGEVPATVAIKQQFGSKLTPTGLTGVAYQWKIDGSPTPPRTTAIKTYAHVIDGATTP